MRGFGGTGDIASHRTHFALQHDARTRSIQRTTTPAFAPFTTSPAWASPHSQHIIARLTTTSTTTTTATTTTAAASRSLAACRAYLHRRTRIARRCPGGQSHVRQTGHRGRLPAGRLRWLSATCDNAGGGVVVGTCSDRKAGRMFQTASCAAAAEITRRNSDKYSLIVVVVVGVLVTQTRCEKQHAILTDMQEFEYY